VAFVCLAEESTVEKRVQSIKETVQRLPQPEMHLLQHLMSFFELVTSHSDVNLMNSSNVAIVIGPNILKSNKVCRPWNLRPADQRTRCLTLCGFL
jgi:RhoGAP domain